MVTCQAHRSGNRSPRQSRQRLKTVSLMFGSCSESKANAVACRQLEPKYEVIVMLYKELVVIEDLQCQYKKYIEQRGKTGDGETALVLASAFLSSG